jgi:hypothetical protein
MPIMVIPRPAKDSKGDSNSVFISIPVQATMKIMGVTG